MVTYFNDIHNIQQCSNWKTNISQLQRTLPLAFLNLLQYYVLSIFLDAVLLEQTGLPRFGYLPIVFRLIPWQCSSLLKVMGEISIASCDIGWQAFYVHFTEDSWNLWLTSNHPVEWFNWSVFPTVLQGGGHSQMLGFVPGDYRMGLGTDCLLVFCKFIFPSAS